MRLILIQKNTIRKFGMRFIWAVLIIGAVVFLSRSTVSVFSIPIRNIVVAIDAGHGGRDEGAGGPSGVTEADINLKIALKLRRHIEQGGGTAIMTREDQQGLYTEQNNRTETRKSEDMRNRKLIIGNSSANLFVSIHLNSFPQSQYYGAQTFYPIGDQNSSVLASCIQNELISVLDNENNRVPKSTDAIYIIRGNAMPSVLIECGFLSNPQEEQLLQQDHYQEKIAWAIFCGIVKYFEAEGKANTSVSK